MADRSLRFLLLGEDKSASKALEGVGKHADRLHSKLAKMNVGKLIGLAGIGAAAATVTAFGKSSLNAFQEATREATGLRRVMGGTIEDASRLNFAAHESGVGYDTVSKSVRLLSKNLIASEKIQQVRTRTHKMEIVQVPKLVKGQIKYVKALRDTGATTVKFVKVSKDLGFVWRDSHGQILPMSKLLPNIAEHFKKMPDGVEKTALALKLFGRGGTEMLPFLNRGAAGIAELTKKSDELGNTISSKDAANMKAYTFAMRDWHAAIKGVKISLGRELMPVLTGWATYLAAHGPVINKWAREYIPTFGRGLGEAGRVVREDFVPPVEGAFKMIEQHQTAAKILGATAGGAFAFVKAMKGVAALQGAITTLRGIAAANTAVAASEVAVTAGAGPAATGLAAVGTAGAGAVAGVGGLGSAIAGLGLAELIGPLGAVVGSFERISALVKGLGGDIGPLLHLPEFGLGSKPKQSGGDLQKQIAGMTSAKREQFYGWYPNLRPKAPAKPPLKTSPYVGSHVSPGNQQIVVHHTTVLDGKVIARSTNSHNAKATRNGSTSARRAAG